MERLMRRVQHMVGVGRTSAPVNDQGAAQTVQVQTYAGVPVSGVKVAQLFGFSSTAPLGSDVVLLSIAGDNSAPIAITTGHQGSRQKNTPPGGAVLYDQGGSLALLNNDGSVKILSSKGSVILMGSDGSISITPQSGTVTLNGSLNATGGVTAGFATANQVTLQQHKHGSAPSGPASPPIPGT